MTGDLPMPRRRMRATWMIDHRVGLTVDGSNTCEPHFRPSHSRWRQINQELRRMGSFRFSCGRRGQRGHHVATARHCLLAPLRSVRTAIVAFPASTIGHCCPPQGRDVGEFDDARDAIRVGIAMANFTRRRRQ